MIDPEERFANMEITYIEGRPDGVYFEGKFPASSPCPFELKDTWKYGVVDCHGNLFAPGCFDDYIARKRKELGLSGHERRK